MHRFVFCMQKKYLSSMDEPELILIPLINREGINSMS